MDSGLAFNLSPSSPTELSERAAPPAFPSTQPHDHATSLTTPIMKTPDQPTVPLRAAIADLQLHSIPHHPKAPPMPPPGALSTMPCLPFLPRSQRLLVQTWQLEPELLHEARERYLSSLPSIAISGDQLSHFVLPRPGFMGYPKAIGVMDHGVHRFSDAILGVAQNVLETVDPSLDAHDVDHDRAGHMSCGWGNSNWGVADLASHRLSQVKVVTVTMPPWCFAPADFAEFATTRAFENPANLFKLDATNASASQKLWARLHDFCYAHNAQYFIVTTYEQWVFGGFSDHMSTGFFTPVMQHDARGPSVFEMILLWLHSAHGHPLGFKIPKVRNERPDFVEPPLSFFHMAVPHPHGARALSLI